MKKTFAFLALAITSMVGTAQSTVTEEEYDLKVMTFEGEYWDSFIDDPQYGGALLYGEGGYGHDEPTYFWIDEGNTLLQNSGLSGAYGSWCYWSGGHAISNYASGDIETYGDYTSQLTVFKQGESDLVQTGGGHNGSNNFAVQYGYADTSSWGLGEEYLPYLTFSDGGSYVFDHMYVNVTNYLLNCLVNGNSLTANIGDDDYVKLIATGYDENLDSVGHTEFYICRGANLTESGEIEIVKDWTKWNLSSLGKVFKLTINITGSSDNGYGFSQPAYFAYDDVAVRVPKTTPTGIKEAFTDNTHNSTKEVRYNLSGMRQNSNSRGIIIVRSADGTVRKVLK